MHNDGPHVPFFKLTEFIIERRLVKDIFHRRDIGPIKKQWRISSLELYFAFLKGPHKFNSGLYPTPSQSFFNNLLLRITHSFCEHDKRKRIQWLSTLISQLDTSQSDIRKMLIFLFLTSNIKAESRALGSFRIPEVIQPGCDRPQTLLNSSFELNLQTDSLMTIYPSKEDLRVQQLLASESCDQKTKNVFRSSLDLDGIDPARVPLFCGAFVNSNSSYGSRRAQAFDSFIALRIPILSPATLEKSFPCLGGERVLHPSGDREDEGYAGSCTDGHIAVDEQNAMQIVLTMLQNATSGLADVLIKRIFPTSGRICASHSPDRISTPKPNSGDSTQTIKSIKRFCWTKRGVLQPTLEAPLLSELGPLAVPICLNIYRTRFGLQDTEDSDQSRNVGGESVPNGDQVLLAQSSFIQEFLLLHLGIPSRRFCWCVMPNGDPPPHNLHAILSGQFLYSFNQQDSLSLGCSEAALSSMLKRNLLAGTHYRQLAWLTRQTDYNVVVGDWKKEVGPCFGDTWTCLCDAISTCLIAYEEGIQLLLERERTVWSNVVTEKKVDKHGPLTFSNKLKIFTDRIEYLADLCFLTCSDRELPHKRGIDILVHLLRHSIQAVNTLDEALIRFIFKRTCRPFLIFLERLLLDGSFTSSTKEFNFHVSNRSLLAKDATFWTDAFRFVSSDPNDPSAHGFRNLVPSGFEQDVLRCAKSVQLLKLIQPKHFLFHHRSYFPKLEFPPNSIATRARGNALSDYLKRVQASAVQLHATRAQRLSRAMTRRQALLKKAAEVHARNLALVEAETQRLIAERRIRKDKELEELKRAAEEASIRRRAALEAEKAADQALLNAVAREQSYRDEVISEARAELESHYASLIEETETRLRAAEKRIEMSRRLNASLEENGAKVREFQAGPSGLTPSNKIDGDHFDSLSFIENEVDGGEILRSSRSVPGASNKSLTEKAQAVSFAVPMEARDDDPLAVLRAKYRHRNAGAFVPEERMFQLLYGGSQPNSTENQTSLSDDAPDPVQPVARNTQVFVTDSYSSMAARFRTRNQCGHASDSTVQDMLYGRGSGPACRDSEWEMKKAADDAQLDAVECAQPDAYAFYREALEPTDSKTGLPKFSKEFPSLSEPPLVNPYRNRMGHVESTRSMRTVVRCATELNRMPLQVMLNRVVLHPLFAYIREVDRAVCNHFLYDLHLMNHFHCLRQLYFLEHGEFAQSLLDELFGKVDGPLSGRSDVYDSVFLRGLMQRVLRKFARECRTDDFNERDSSIDVDLDYSRACFSEDCPIDLVTTSGNPNTTVEDVVDPRRALAFEHLSVLYVAPWPVNIILRETVLLKYNCVFRQLVRIKFAVWALNSCYHHLRERRTVAESLDRAGQWTQQSESQFHQTSVWLHEMNQVMRGLETYLAHQAVKASWSKFMKRLIGFNPDNVESLSLSSSSSQSAVIENLDQLISVHEAYVDDVLRNCLLDSSYSEIQQVICGLLSCVYWFYKVLSTGSWLSRTSLITGQLNSTGWAQLQAAHASFVQHTRFLRRRVGCMLSTSRTDPSTSLSQLVLALGINDFYNVRIGDLQSAQKNSSHRDNFADQLNTRRA